MIKRLLPLGFLSLLLAGCTTTITNLTPSRLPRNPENTYHFEALLDTSEQAIRTDSVEAYVLIDLQSYPMQPTPLVKHRWEAFIPIPPEQKTVHYRYKFDYLYSSIPEPRMGSRLSPPYRLQIVEPK